MKSLCLLIVCFLLSTSMFSQQDMQKLMREKDLKIDSLIKIDFLAYKYKYLDENFKIKIPKEVYEKAFVDYKFIPERIKTYKDSLGVVLMAEFKDWDAERIASFRINYSWKRLSYYLWMKENEVLELAKKLNVKMPYRLKELFEKNDPKVQSELQNLRDKIYLKTAAQDIFKLSTKDLLNYAFKHNSELIELRKKEHNHAPQKRN
ncbi:hypothetical protein K6T82_09325 [Flavobacterium sp. 17A]|uniref:Uncharacterized protein n=1 Tax=Flavobacterium potami TaxID=2872310 RepID=A0A9X1H940_9FLAO|nr:hypothetical protein [Flavobacterium potami]MBZ4034968.1 hypothetical protein [Flavobacterium potami]